MTAEPALAADPPWRDVSRPVDERVTDLLSRMTTEEKIAQLYGVWVGADAEGQVAPHQHDVAEPPADWDTLITLGLGQLTRPFGTSPVDPAVGAKALARTQEQIVAAGRHGIPALVHEECLTGFAAWQATVTPSPLCWGASFDPDLVAETAAAIGESMRGVGVHQGLAPVLDVVRDLRWGRVEECIGEDPFLVATIGAAYVRGLESAGIVSTLKHFVGYSASRGARNLAPVSMGPRELADVMLPPFELALRAGARSVMNSYTDVDGVPVAADASLLTGLLRDQLGFTGTVVADYFSITFLALLHGAAECPEDAAGLALTAGIDVELPTVHCYGEPLLRQVQTGAVDEAWVDRAARRVLRQKAELGLLDPDWSPLVAGAADLDPPAARALARRLALRSTVLLAHDAATLPIAPATRVAVVGPRADDPAAVMGCYSFPQHVGVHHPEVPVGLEVATVLSALRGDPAGLTVTTASGGTATAATDAEIAEAAAVAAAAQVCVVVLGDQAGLFGGTAAKPATSGEGCDATDLRLPGRQGDLLEALLATGTPVVAVLLVGRPYELAAYADRLAAVVCAFYPGEEGGGAIADLLTGRADFTGRLPVTFPGGGAGQPVTGYGAPLAQRSEVSALDPSPLWAFGHGLSLRRAEWGPVEVAHSQWATDDRCTVHVSLRNPHAEPVSEVVQVYLHDPVAEVARPVRMLVAAPRVDLAPGASAQVSITLHADQTSYSGRDLRRRVDPGQVRLLVGRSAADIETELALTLVGEPRFVGHDRVMTPETVVTAR